jgi:hypothetical protein
MHLPSCINGSSAAGNDNWITLMPTRVQRRAAACASAAPLQPEIIAMTQKQR